MTEQIGYAVCSDGGKHQWSEEIMHEDGVEHKIMYCRKCGYWF